MTKIVSATSRVRHWLAGAVALSLVAAAQGVPDPVLAVPQAWPYPMATVSAGELTVWSTEGATSLALPRPVFAADLDPTGEVVAATWGTPIEEAVGGVALGVVDVINLNDLSTIATIPTTDVLTHVALSPTLTHVAYVKNYSELWVADLVTRQQFRVASAASLAPAVVGGMIFDPAFSSSGTEIFFGLLEKHFGSGEDDKLDNIWKVTLGGQATRVTALSTGVDESDWQIIRRPLPQPDGSLMFTSASSKDAVAAESPPTGEVNSALDSLEIRPEGFVPPLTIAIGVGSNEAGDRQIAFLAYNEATDKFDPDISAGPRSASVSTSRR